MQPSNFLLVSLLLFTFTLHHSALSWKFGKGYSTSDLLLPRNKTTPPPPPPPGTPGVRYPPPPPPPPAGKAPAPYPPTKPPKNTKECYPLCEVRCQLHSRKKVCLRACVTCCERCKCVPPGHYGNKDKCGKCYANMTTHGGRPKCP